MRVKPELYLYFFLLCVGMTLTKNLSAQLKLEVKDQVFKPKLQSNLKITSEAHQRFSGISTNGSSPQIKNYTLLPYSKVINQNSFEAIRNIKKIYDHKGEVIAYKGSVQIQKKLNTHEERVFDYLKMVTKGIHKKNSKKSYEINSSELDKDGRRHTKIDQLYDGVKIFGQGLIIHENQLNSIYLLQGTIREIGESISVIPTLNQKDIIKVVKSHLNHFILFPASIAKLMNQPQISVELNIYKSVDEWLLAYVVDIYSSLGERSTVIVNAHDGGIIKEYNTLCKIHGNQDNVVGKAIGSSTDLLGEQRSINVYECTDGYFMVDASRPMFKGAETSCDNSDQLLNGVIITLDARNTSPVNSNFDYQIGASNSLNNWNNPTAVSAHFNGGKAYEYFKSTFGRESITGNGTNIVSFINVAEDDGSQMDNAYWNGEFIFYGNGNNAFNAPLAKALDVAGHEMSHGVIQTTANLLYQGESGALNEHFADVFGVLIEREDFRIGEDITNPNIFPTGTLRNMQDPNNGGSRLGDPGYQPAHVDDQYFGNEDNGGVHINSGIPNLAFFTFVNDPSYGTSIDERAAIAERIWYKALTQYLRSSANFSDMRIAIIQSAQEDYGDVVATAAANAFDKVGITGQGITAPVEEIDRNPGNEYVVWSNLDLDRLNVSSDAGELLGAISNTSHISRPSSTDNGRFVIFVNAEKQIQAVEIDWSTGEIVSEFLVSEEKIYRNATISRDATKIAAVTGDLSSGEFDNKIIVFDLTAQNFKEFELFNPTFSEDETNTAGVLYADVLEFDFTSENLIYDAFNQLSGVFGDDLSYWDIGIINVYDNDKRQFSEGSIFKLFSGLPQDVSIGNPTFSKNSPNIIAFDYREIDPITNERSYSVLGLDRESGDVKVIFENNTFGYPSYSLDDDQMIFNFVNNDESILAIADLQEDKISANDDVFIFTESADWGIFIGDGDRNLSTSTEEQFNNSDITIYPNPSTNNVYVDLVNSNYGEVNVQLINIDGAVLIEENSKGSRKVELNLYNLKSGYYLIKIQAESEVFVKKIIKL